MIDGELPGSGTNPNSPAALELFPDATVLHLGLFRDKSTLQAIE